MGFAAFPGFALRVDILERIAARIRAQARLAATFEIPPAWPPRPGSGGTSWPSWWRRWASGPRRGSRCRVLQPGADRAATAISPCGGAAAAGPGGSPFAVLARLRAAP